jgi:23S rRNA pseudouridine2457 synthase
VPTIIFNKPYGVLSQFTDEGTGHPTLKEYIPVPGVYAAGRLDRDSEGLLLLTDDGSLVRQLTMPRHIEKTYWVMVEGKPLPQGIERLRGGIQLKNYRTAPARVTLIPEPSLPPRSRPVTPHGPVSWLEIGLTEGRKRQIRHMTAAVGLFTLRLVRVAIGPVTLAGLPEGEWRELTRSELEALRRPHVYNTGLGKK